MSAKNTKTILLRSTILVGAAAFALPAFAQTAPTKVAAAVDATPVADSEPVITVTGSLIKNPNLVSSSPVAVIGSDEIALRQSNVAEEVLRTLPGVVPNIGAAVNNGNGGASYVDLRGLGSNRNIVLIDGNRITPSNTVGRVDLNNIPLALVERTEALTGGASTTYGADAISGVVNFVTKKNFSGVNLSAGYQIDGKGDGAYYHTDLTIGANLADGRGNVVLSIGYQHADPVSQGDRQFSNTQYSSTTGKSAGSDVTVPAEIILNGQQTQIDPTTGLLVPVYQQFNFNPYNVFQTPFKRANIYAAGNYELSDNIEVYARGLFSKNTVDTVIAPSGIFDEDLFVPVSNPFLPLGARNQLCADQGITPTQCTLAAAALTPTDPNYKTLDVETLRRTPDVGPRVSDYVTTVFDYRFGAKGKINEHINWDVNGSYGESENLQTIQNYVLLSRVKQAVAATNTTTCIDTSKGCVPLNIFGGAGSITPAQAAFLTANSSTRNRTSLAQARGVLNGDLGFASPFATDAIGFAVGTEYRKYTATQNADLLAKTAGELGGAGGAAPDIKGGYEVTEGFGELIAPVIQDKPFFNKLELEAGIRYSHYKVDAAGSPSYNTTTYKGGGTWEPADGFRIRGIYQHAVRAPNINELFTPVTVGLTNLTTEPCVGAAPLTDANLKAICLAQGAPAASIGTIAKPNSGQANETSGGNINLKPETSNSFTVGGVFQPTFVRSLSLSVDYYNIKVANAITLPTPGDALDSCFGSITAASAASAACTGIRRNPGTGQLSGSPSTTFGLPLALSNNGALSTDGIDISANYSRDIGFAKLNLFFQGNYTMSSKFRANVLSSKSINRDCTGYYSTNCPSIQPQVSWTQRTTLSFDVFDVSVLWRHISPTKFEPITGTRFSGTLVGGDLNGQSANFNKIPSYNYFDLTGRAAITKSLDLTLTVSNLFDRNPPVVGNTIGATAYNSGNTYPSTYDALGRRFAFTVNFKY